ncbi:MAG: hypothetical protein ACTSRU_03680, partial [Candidatus Hodarchaeales archaeon]
MATKQQRRGSGIEDIGYDFEHWGISLHNRNLFELLVDYKLDPNSNEAQFQIELFFFIPASFRINAKTYSKKAFYQDMQAYIRFKPKLITLSNIVNEDNAISPLVRANMLLEEIFQGGSSKQLIDQVIHELKMLANLVITYVVKEVHAICDSIIEVDIPQQVKDDAIRRIIRLIRDIKEFNTVIKKTRIRYMSSVSPREVRETFEFITEFLSLNFQRVLTRLLNNVEFVCSTHKEFKDTILIIQQSINSEREHRELCEYPSILNQGEDNEEFSYRWGILKKYISNVLYLKARPKRKTRAIQELGYAAAAGLAMFIALIITFAAQTMYGNNLSLPFIVAVVIGYMIKDRVKEWGRFITKFTTKRRYDYKSKIKDNQGNVIGYSQESFSFIDYKNVPNDILQVRGDSALSAIESEGKPQEVIRYIKRIKLLPK